MTIHRRRSWRVEGRYLAAVLMLAVAAACGGESRSEAGSSSGPPVRGGTAVVCLQSAPESLDPFVSPDEASVQLGALLFTPLVRYGSGETVEPYLARSWQWGDGHRDLVFHLRTDLTWQDGPPVTASDVAFTLRAAADSAYGYLDQADLKDLDSVTVVDSATVRAHFRRPLAAGLEVFATLPILPEHLLGKLGPQAFAHASYHHQPVGSGPYRLVAWRSDGTIEFERFDRFPAELGPDYLDRIAFRVVPEASTRMAELRTGGANACRLSPPQAADVAKVQGARALAFPPIGTYAIYVDTKQPPLSDVRVRRALSAALDRGEVAGVVSSVAAAARAPLPAGAPFAVPGLRQPDDDTVLADSLLAAAGWRSSGAGGVRTGPGGRRLSITLAGQPQLENVVTVIQAELARVGFEVKPDVEEYAALIQRVLDPARRPQAVLLGSVPDKRLRPDFYTSLVTGGPTNISSYSNAAVDSAAARLRTDTDSADIAAQYRVLERRVVEDLPLIYVIRVPQVFAVGPRLRGVKVGPNGPFASAPWWWLPGGKRR